MIVLAVLATVYAVVASTMQESMSLARVTTADAELRSRAQMALATIVADLRAATPSGSGVTVSQVSGTSYSQIKFAPIIGCVTSPSLAPLYATTNTGAPAYTIYSWNPSLTTGIAPWTASVLTRTLYAKYTPPPTTSLTIPVCGDVSGFSITPVGTTVFQNFNGAASLTLQLSLTLTRRHVMQSNVNDLANPDGRMSVTVTTEITLPPG